MNITIHRGTNQIGGCVTEYESNGWRLFVDFGEQLPGTPVSAQPLEIEGLTCGDISKSALLITHYHGDHIGKIAELSSELPIYMGKIARDIASELSEHLSSVNETQAKIAKRLADVKTFMPGKPFSFGSFKIMPVIVDHSAFDAYAFRIETDALKVFHTGDFRTHGFRSGKLPVVIDRFVGKVDYVVCEATNVKRPDATQEAEPALQSKFEHLFTANKFNIVYLSSTNIDRLFGLYHAALRAHRPFYVDAYQKSIMDTVVGRDPIWRKSEFYQYKEYEPIVLQRERNDFRINDKFKDFLTERGYVLIARSNPRFDSFIDKIPGEPKQHYLSMWTGYVNPSLPAYNHDLAKSLGPNFKPLHTSGHCDMKSLENLIVQLNPKAIIPIHTDDPQAFARIFCNKWPVRLLHDGETFSLSNNP